MKYTYLVICLSIMIALGCKNADNSITISIQTTESKAIKAKEDKSQNDVIQNEQIENTKNETYEETHEDFFKWSEPVNGLIARIEGVATDTTNGDVIFVRLMNVGGSAFEVPTSNPTERKDGVYFKVFNELTKDSVQSWYHQDKYDDDEYWNQCGNRIDRPNQMLKKGESVIVFLCGSFNEKSAKSSMLKVSLECNESENEQTWIGKIETPKFKFKTDFEVYKEFKHKLDFPNYYPEFSHTRAMGWNISPFEPQYGCLCVSNGIFLLQLNLYKPETMIETFERRFIAEKDQILKIMYATVAVECGSEKAKEFLLKSRKVTSYEIVCATLEALKDAVDNDRPQEWIIDELIASIEDENIVTDWPSSHSDNQSIPISYIADEQVYITMFLGWIECKKAVPALIRQLRNSGRSRHYISALGAIGDKRAIPVLMEFLEKGFKELDRKKEDYLPDDIERLLSALINLEAKDIVSYLVKAIQFPDAIDKLRHLRVKEAYESLKKIVENNGIIEGVNNSGKCVKRRLDAAIVALAALSDDPTPEFCKLLFDMELDEFVRRDVVAELAYHPDERAIPYLVKVIKTDPSGTVVNPAIEVLAYYKYKDAVKGLIECFDANFDGKDDWKRAYTQEMFRDNVAKSLRKITGQNLGTDKEQWLKWFETKGRLDTSLK